jgi:hypothetical protein
MDIELSADDPRLPSGSARLPQINAYRPPADYPRGAKNGSKRLPRKGGWDVPKWPKEFGGPVGHRRSTTSGSRKPRPR